MFSFCFLHTNMHHLILQGNGEGHRTYLILRRRRRRRWWCWVLCFTVSSVSVRLSSLSLFLLSAFGSSSGFYSQRTRVFLVSRRASRWRGLSAAIRSLLDLESAPLSLPTSPSFIITEYQLLQAMKWWKRRCLGFFHLAIECFAVL
ncbi:hypothetical protein BDE02_01G196300 [Populus trichocarpa]|nr:hypothetical protein BDE02_01G196300 [Populus trichocarpa]